jgi:hypothetical protein
MKSRRFGSPLTAPTNQMTDVRTRVDLEVFSGMTEVGSVAAECGGGMESRFLLDLLSNVLLFCWRGVSAYGNSLRSTCVQYQNLSPDSSQILKHASPVNAHRFIFVSTYFLFLFHSNS